MRHFVQVFSKRAHRVIETIPSSTMDVLTLYRWPGNVRELKNLLERSVILSRGRVLEIPPRDVRICTPPVPDRVEESRTLEAVERAHIVSTLNRTGWVLSRPNGAAAILGVAPSKRRNQMKRLSVVRARTDLPALISMEPPGRLPTTEMTESRSGICATTIESECENGRPVGNDARGPSADRQWFGAQAAARGARPSSRGQEVSRPSSCA
jgi:hypothetical protein